MAELVHLDVRGVREAQKALARFEPKELRNRLRRATAAGAKAFQGPLKETAAAHHGGLGNVPASFEKVPAPKRSTSGGEISARIKPRSPLFNIFEVGAGQHEIAPRGEALAGPAGGSSWTPKGRKRGSGFFSRTAVHHPGLRARPILPQAFAAGLPTADQAIASTLFGPDK